MQPRNTDPALTAQVVSKVESSLSAMGLSPSFPCDSGEMPAFLTRTSNLPNVCAAVLIRAWISSEEETSVRAKIDSPAVSLLIKLTVVVAVCGLSGRRSAQTIFHPRSPYFSTRCGTKTSIRPSRSPCHGNLRYFMSPDIRGSSLFSMGS